MTQLKKDDLVNQQNTDLHCDLNSSESETFWWAKKWLLFIICCILGFFEPKMSIAITYLFIFQPVGWIRMLTAAFLNFPDFNPPICRIPFNINECPCLSLIQQWFSTSDAKDIDCVKMSLHPTEAHGKTFVHLHSSEFIGWLIPPLIIVWRLFPCCPGHFAPAPVFSIQLLLKMLPSRWM